MGRVGGRFVPLSVGRRLMDDFLSAGRHVVGVPIQRRMHLGPVVAARDRVSPRPSWCAIFTKAFATVTARHPELRRAYVAAPWPRLFQYDRTVAGVAIERNYRRERARRRARIERRSAAKHSNVRFWVMLLVLAFLTAFAILAAWHEVQKLFGV